MARDAIQDHWGKMNGKQRKEYMKLMKDLLEKAVYQDTHENLQKGKVQFLGDRTRGTRSKVMTKIYIPDEDMEIDNDFLMKNFPSLWKVQDIYIDGASLIEDYRSQFNKIVREHGLEGNENALFPRLRKAVKEEKDDWRQSWKSKKDKKEKPEKKERPTLLEGL
jgi:phospholipid transport system substrate-binding protein